MNPTFETFANFKKLNPTKPVLKMPAPEWAAAAHVLIVEDTIHYYWAHKKPSDTAWELMHSTAPIEDPYDVEHDPKNPILTAGPKGAFDDTGVEYPFPFFNPHDGQYYMYYLGNNGKPLKQTGLLMRGDDFSTWHRVSDAPVIPIEHEYEKNGSSHPSVAIDGDTIHILYTGEGDGLGGEHHPYNNPVLCHATAPLSDPADVTKDPNNPLLLTCGQPWDQYGIRETEILKAGEFFHIFYGGYNGKIWQIGHVRTKDFRTFEPNPANPILTASPNPEDGDTDGLLTPHVFKLKDEVYMLYAGLNGGGEGGGWGGDASCNSYLAKTKHK